jgi:anti-sigma factor RsiW
VNSTRAEGVGKDQLDLNAYHDGELRGLRRWMFERRLAHSTQLRAELEELKRVSQWVQAFDPQSARVDVWDHIALQLPAIDATRGERRAGRDAWLGMDWLATYSRPIAAVAVTAALALALFLGIMEDAAPPTPGMIHWLDTGGRSVMVLEDPGGTTIVWLLEAPEAGASEGGLREAV